MRAFALLVGLLLAGCGTGLRVPDLSTIYGRVAMVQGTERQLLITVPGILGSQLVETESEKVLWGDGFRLVANLRADENLERFALPFGNGTTPNHLLRDTVQAGKILHSTTARLLGLPVEVEVYSGILSTLRTGGWIGEDDITPEQRQNGKHVTSYQFAYDWRLDLELLIADFDAYVKARFANQPAGSKKKIDLMAHSMGSLIGRYYLMYGNQPLPQDGSLPKLNWAGAKYFSNAIFIAPPNAGSVSAFHDLIEGSALGPFQPTLSAPLTGSIFSTYLLMPRNRHNRVRFSDTGETVDIYDPKIWQRYGWGLADPSADSYLQAVVPDATRPEQRRKRALRFQADALARAEQFHRALDRPAVKLPDDLTIYLVVGGSHKTPAQIDVDRATGAIEYAAYEEGDGLVLRVSSLLDERQGTPDKLTLATPLVYSSVLFLPEEHTGLTRSPVFGDNLLFWLLQSTRDAEFLANARARRTAPERRNDLSIEDFR